jgi:geranylgeranyl diphosphate synthase type II
MTPDSWWRRRSRCAHAVMAGSFSHGLGTMDRVEPRLAAALRDILAHRGSLVRAVAAYLVGIEMGMAEQAARALGCGIEYLHTASIIFDDLPAMDDARTRRGSPCVHVIHGESVAMLAALALINRGYTMLWQGIRHASPANREKAGEWVDARLGVHGVIGGQSYDLSGWRGSQNPVEVSEVAARKTADLLRLTIVLPAIIGRASTRELTLLDRLAVLRGLAYQAADDIKDVLGSDVDSGKTAGRDEELGRPNIVAAEGLPAAMHRLHRLNQAAERVTAALPGDPSRWSMLEMLRVPSVCELPTHTEADLPAAV